MQHFKLLSLTAAVMAGLGLASNAHAGAYAVAWDDVTNLTLTSDPTLGIGAVTTFITNASADATLNTASPPSINDADNETGPTRYVVASRGDQPRTSTTNGTSNPPNNGFGQIGPVGTYAGGAAQILTTEIAQDPNTGGISFTGDKTQAVNIAESNIGSTATGSAGGRNSSVTGLDFGLSISQAPSVITFSFNADPYMQALLTPGVQPPSSALAALTVVFSITDAGGATVFSWAPDGNLSDAAGITGGHEISDPLGKSLNKNISTNTAGSTITYNPNGVNGTGNLNPAVGAFNFYSASTNLLPVGQYSVSLTMTESVQTRARVPEPASLSLLGVGLVGLSLLKRRHQKV